MKPSRIAFLACWMTVAVAFMVACPGKSGRSGDWSRSRSGAPAGAAAVDPQEMRQKADRIRVVLEQWKREGKDPAPVFRLTSQVEPLMKQGRHEEAMAKLDEALAMVDPDYAPAAAAPARPTEPAAPAPLPAGRAAGKGWTHASSSPVIGVKRPPAGLPSSLQRLSLLNWNDPSVMKEGSGYSMWLSMGSEGGGRNVSIFKLTSSDGLDWRAENGGQPVLRPGRRSEFDFFGVETPAVIKVGSTYHMYYTAYHEPDPRKGGHIYTMGHATSPDGVRWTKKGELLPLTDVVGRQKGNPWGWLARAEPAVVHHDGTFYLYFADVRCRRDNCKGVPVARRGISLATSKDGHAFVQHGSEPVLLQSASYPASDGWEGYSTPWVYHDGRYFQLYVDLFRHLDYGHYQTRIAHYRSEDGIRFEEVAADIVQIEGHPWARMSVRAPTVIEDGDQIKMWYAGDAFDKRKHKGADMMAGRIALGIALVTTPR